MIDAHESCEYTPVCEPGEYPFQLRIEDMAWDPQEDNLLVSFGDKGMCLISYQGFSPETRVVKRFDPPQHVVNNIAWMPDRSGNFVTTNEKVGIVLSWNVASNEPSQAIKVGAKGTHSMTFLDLEADKSGGARLLISLKNGALQVYNLKRQSVEF